MGVTWELKENDKDFFQKELNNFIPDKVYDVHAHLYKSDFWKTNLPEHVNVGERIVTMEVYKKQMEWILPGREIHAMHFPFPPGAGTFDVKAANEWIGQEIKKDSLARGQFLVLPEDDPDWVREEVNKLGMRGLKPFSTFAKIENKELAEIPDYLPESLMDMANKEGWSITLHMRRPNSAADPSNIHWIKTYCKRYPNAQIILDHCARGFNTYHALEGLSKIGKFPNLWVDTSVICSPMAIIASIQNLGIDHVLYASDYYCSNIRGVVLPYSDSFLWLDENSPLWKESKPNKSVLIGLENLRAIKAAFWSLKLTDKEVEMFFSGNAQKLLNI